MTAVGSAARRPRSRRRPRPPVAEHDRPVPLGDGGAGAGEHDVGQVAQGREDPVVAGGLQALGPAVGLGRAVDRADEVDPQAAGLEPVGGVELVRVDVVDRMGEQGAHPANPRVRRRVPGPPSPPAGRSTGR